ncbi:MAG: hypothetical protein HY079_01260 [Elusimicrobia bacterium]|nr:hypothetical protein [Elusimicrobiota bacterium]
MMKNALLLAAGLAALAAPAFATHPNEVCRIKIDVAALAKAAGADPSSVRVRFVFAGGISNLTDMTPPAPVVVSKPAEGPWIYATELHSNLYYRRLAAVKVESILYKTTDGTPEWTAAVDRPAQDTDAKDAPIRCEQYAD